MGDLHGSDNDALCGFSKCVFADPFMFVETKGCDEHVCLLKCIIAFKKMLYKAHCKTAGCPFNPTVS